MINNQWKIKVDNKFGNFKYDIYLYYESHDGVYIAEIVNGQIQTRKFNENSELNNPTFTFPCDLWESLKSTLIDEKVRDKNEIEAELGATKNHLSDLRKLLKIK